MPAEEICYLSLPASEEELWSHIKVEARIDVEAEPALASYLYSTILSHSSLGRSLSFHLGNKLCSSTLLSTLHCDLFLNSFSTDASLRSVTVSDLRASSLRDPACLSFSHCLLNYKGFLACQECRNEGFEDLHVLFQEIFQSDTDTFGSSFCSTTCVSSQDSCSETSITSNKRNSFKMSSRKFASKSTPLEDSFVDSLCNKDRRSIRNTQLEKECQEGPEVAAAGGMDGSRRSRLATTSLPKYMLQHQA